MPTCVKGSREHAAASHTHGGAAPRQHKLDASSTTREHTRTSDAHPRESNLSGTCTSGEDGGGDRPALLADGSSALESSAKGVRRRCDRRGVPASLADRLRVAMGPFFCRNFYLRGPAMDEKASDGLTRTVRFGYADETVPRKKVWRRACALCLAAARCPPPSLACACLPRLQATDTAACGCVALSVSLWQPQSSSRGRSSRTNPGRLAPLGSGHESAFAGAGGTYRGAPTAGDLFAFDAAAAVGAYELPKPQRPPSALGATRATSPRRRSHTKTAPVATGASTCRADC